MRPLVLPSWAEEIGKGKIKANAAEFYPELLAELGVAEADIDQYWLEVAFQCMKMDIQHAVSGTEGMPTSGGALQIAVVDPEKNETGSKWNQKKWPEGKGVALASKGRESLDHYNRIRVGLV